MLLKLFYNTFIKFQTTVRNMITKHLKTNLFVMEIITRCYNNILIIYKLFYKHFKIIILLYENIMGP